MKRILASVLSIMLFAGLISAQKQDPVLMTINGKEIGLSEFEYIYNKNNSANVVDKKTLDEYVDLFVIFKLKVEEAIAQGIDTTRAFRSELEMYRSQLAEQYLQKNNWTDHLIEEVYKRKKEEINASHILVRIPESGTTADTLKAYNKAMEIYKRAQKEDFAALAGEVSEDNSTRQNGGLLGWLPILRTPYSFETTAYNTDAGQVSKPVRTLLGYHIIKVNNRRPSQGEVRVAHVMLMHDRENPDSEALKARADSIHRCLVSGEDFAEMAKKHSDDVGTAQNGGELPWFGTGHMVPEFEEAAFAIKHTSHLSEPVKSAYGWHIIKLIDRKQTGSLEKEKSSLVTMIEQSELAAEKENAFISDLKEEYAFTENRASLNDFINAADLYALNDSAYGAAIENLNAPLFSFADRKYTQADFTNFLMGAPRPDRGVRSDFLIKKYNDFVNVTIKQYERDNLGAKYPDYRNLMQEYHDGILLFEVMNKEVWEKASQDKEGLAVFFENNRNDYSWSEPYYKGRVIQAMDKSSLKAAKNILKRADNDSIDSYIKNRVNDSIQYVKVQKGLWAKGENELVDQKIFKTGKLTPSGDYPYVFFSGKLLKNPEEYSDVRGSITANYQDYLEKVWVQSLREKFPVVIDDKVLKQVKKN